MADKNDPEPDASELLNILKPMIRFSGRLERGTVDLARPRTEISRLKRQIDASLDGLDGAALVSSLRELLRAITPEDITVALTDLPPRPQRRSCGMLNSYLDLVEAGAPFAISIIYGGSKLIGLDFAAKTLEALGKLRDAARGSGETRIEALRVAAGFVLEAQYKELVTVLYEIECVRRSREVTAGLEFGNLVENVAHSTADLLPAFIDRHAARMRNAACHDRWCERDDGSGVLDLHDAEAALRGLTQPQIYGRLRDRYRDVQDLAHCLLWRATASLALLCSRPPLNVALAADYCGKPYDQSLAEAARAVLDGAMGGAVARLQAVNWLPRNQPTVTPAV